MDPQERPRTAIDVRQALLGAFDRERGMWTALTPAEHRSVAIGNRRALPRPECVAAVLRVLNSLPGVKLEEIKTRDDVPNHLVAVFDVGVPSKVHSGGSKIDQAAARHILLRYHRDGVHNYSQIARELDAAGYPTTGKAESWPYTSVRRFIHSESGQRVREMLITAGELSTTNEAERK